MSERWKNISNTDKSVIKANTIFANKLIGNNSEFRKDICFNNIDISFDEDIIIDNVKTVHTHNSIKTILLKSNVIDLSNTDPSYIDISSVIYTNLSGGFYYLRAKDFSTSDLYVDNLSVNAISLLTGNNYLHFNSDSVSFDNTIMASDISVNYIGSLYDSSMTIHPDTIIEGKLNVGTLVTENIYNAQPDSNSYIEIDGDISTIHISAMDISVSHSTKVGGHLSLSTITSKADSSYITFNTDISVNGYADASAVTVHNIYAYEQPILEIKNDLSINGGLRVHDISFNGSLSPIDGCLNVVGDISFTKHIQAKETIIKSFTHHSSDTQHSHNDGSGIVFQNDVSIGGIILANNKPKDYKAVVSDDFNKLIFELANNYQDGALGLLTPAPEITIGEPVYTDDSLNNFNPSNNDASYVSLDFNNSQNKVTLYLQVSTGNVKKIATINDDISLHAIRMTRGSDISNWTNAYNDVSHTFGYNTSAIIGLRNGEFNDDSYNRVHYLNVSAFDPEGFDVSHMFYCEAETSPDSYQGFDVSFVNDAGYRIKVITPSLESVPISELSFNIVVHDYTNYIIRQVSLEKDKHLIAKEPSWNEIKLRTYDFSYQEIMDTELSWNDFTLNNKISEADTRDVSTAYFDISLNQYFGDNSDNIYYVIDLSAIYNTSDPSFISNLDLSFNIEINDGDLSRNIELSGSKLIVETSIPNDKTIADYEIKDTSINIIVHNYYDFTNSSDPSFDFDAAGITADDYGYTSDDNTNYSKDNSRNIVLKVHDSIINKAPYFTNLTFYGISYGDGWKTDFYNDNSFDSSFYNFNDSNDTNSSLNDPSFTYYIWDTSSIYDNSSLQYRIDLSGLDPEGFNIDISKNYTDTSMNLSFTGLPGSKRSLIVTTTGRRNNSEIDSSLSLFFDDCGNFISDMCYNKINLTFHPFLYKFKEFTFTNCDETGNEGPTLNDCSNEYTERYNISNDISSLDYWWTKQEYLGMDETNNPGIQLWTVPATGQYDITIAGAGGGRSYAPEKEDTREGYGAVFDTSVILHRGDKYRILIGQRGQLGNTNSANITGYQDKIPMASSGGGGTFFVKDDHGLNIGIGPPDIDITLTTSNSDPDAVMDVINDISDLFIAVAGGGSGGRTWDDDTIETTITDASRNKTANSGDYQDEGTRAPINVDEYAPGREIGQLTLEDGNVYSGQFPYTGGGGGGGLFRVGGYAGTDIRGDSHQAQPFILGGKGGFNTNNNIGIIGNAKEGGFGGGGAGGDGGSGGGGGYAGGGADTHTKIVGDILSGNNINPEKKSYAGGGSSFVNETLHNMTMSNYSQNKNSDSNGYLHIRFNPYNK